MALPIRARMPVRSELADEDGLISRTWRLYLRGQGDTLASSPVVAGRKSLAAGQAAAIGATPMPIAVEAGFYRVSIYARRTQVATTSSDLAVLIGFTESGVSLTVTTGVDATNAVTKVLAGSWVIKCDANTTITYETTYASVGAQPMQYKLDVIVERVQV